MDENKLRFGVGVLVISAIGIGIILTFLFGAFPTVLKREYGLSVVFPSAEGIMVNTPVVRDGVRIGRVADIQLRDEGGVLVTLSMDSSQSLTHEYIPHVGMGNFVTGDAQLEFVKATEEELTSIFDDDQDIRTRPYTDGEYLDYGKKTQSLFELQDDLQSTFDSIRQAGQSIAVASNSVNDLAIEIREAVGGVDSRFERVSDEAVQALQEFQGAVQDIRTIVGDPDTQQNLERTLELFPQVLEDAQSALATTEQTFETFEQVGVQFEKVGVAAETAVNDAQAAINNLEAFTEPLAERGDELVSTLITSLTRFESALAEVEVFGRTLNNNDGSLKRFLEDDEIYWQVRRSVENIEYATARVRPILDDVRIFTDKIARDPRELGVRGALNRRPSGAGIK